MIGTLFLQVSLLLSLPSYVYGHSTWVCATPGTTTLRVYAGNYHTPLTSVYGGIIIAGGASGSEQYGVATANPYAGDADATFNTTGQSDSGAHTWLAGKRFNFLTGQGVKTYTEMLNENPSVNCKKIGGATNTKVLFQQLFYTVDIPVDVCDSSVTYYYTTTCDREEDCAWSNVWASIPCTAGIYSAVPTRVPTHLPPSATYTPTATPTGIPTHIPTHTPTHIPTHVPTSVPTHEPTGNPTGEPTGIPSSEPSGVPTQVPTEVPPSGPSGPVPPPPSPTYVPTHVPTRIPTVLATEEPTMSPTSEDELHGGVGIVHCDCPNKYDEAVLAAIIVPAALCCICCLIASILFLFGGAKKQNKYAHPPAAIVVYKMDDDTPPAAATATIQQELKKSVSNVEPFEEEVPL